MSDTQRFGQSQTGSDTDGRSPEYNDNLTTQDQTAPAGYSPGGVRPAGVTDSDYGANIDGAGRDRTSEVTQDESNTLISADKVQGTAVYDQTGERLGTIDSLMLNKRSGKVAYAVMSFGGFLGIGERYHPLPWDVLTYDIEKGGYNVGVSQDELRSGPTYSRDELDVVGDDRRYGAIDDYYGRAGLNAAGGGIPIV